MSTTLSSNVKQNKYQFESLNSKIPALEKLLHKFKDYIPKLAC